MINKSKLNQKMKTTACTQYSSNLSHELALHHHHLVVEVQVECEVLWVLVWVGCHCTGHLSPTLETEKNTLLIPHMQNSLNCSTTKEQFRFQHNNWFRANKVRESKSPGHQGDTHLVWWSSWGHRAAEGVGVGEEGTSLGHVHVSALLSRIPLQ